MENCFEVVCVFVTTKSGGKPLFLKIYKKNKNENSSEYFMLATYLTSLFTFGAHLYQAGLLDEELEVEHLGYMSKSGNKNIEFVFSIKDSITTILGVRYKKKSEEIGMSVRKKVVQIANAFTTMFKEELESRDALLIRYMEEFEPTCDSIIGV